MSMCTPDMTLADYIVQFKFIEALACPYINSMGLVVFGTLMYGAVATSIYIRTGNVAIPTILLFLTGGVVLQQVAGPGVGIATLLVLLTVPLALVLVWYRLAR